MGFLQMFDELVAVDVLKEAGVFAAAGSMSNVTA